MQILFISLRTVMKQYLISILTLTIFAFGLTEVRNSISQESLEKTSATGVMYAESGYLNSTDNEFGTIDTNDCFSLANFSLRIFDIPLSLSSVPRGLSFPKNLRFNSTIQVLSSLTTPLVVRNTKNLYLQYCFVKSSCRYFVYTLERMLN